MFTFKIKNINHSKPFFSYCEATSYTVTFDYWFKIISFDKNNFTVLTNTGTYVYEY